MKTTKREDYAIVFMTALASADSYLSLKKVSDQYHLPYPFMKQISFDLGRAGLVGSKGGSAGGYKLAKPAEEISWKDIVVAVEGEPVLVECLSDDKRFCPIKDTCPSAKAWSALRDKILGAMENVKLSEFV